MDVRFPDPGTASGALAVLSPGGGYPRSVLDLHVPGFEGYSVVDALVERGHTVVLVDIAGTAEGAEPRGDDVTMAVAAEHLDAAVRDLDLPGIVARVGVGHSLGAAVTLDAQARRGTFDAIALLGYSPRWSSLAEQRPDHEQTLAALRARDGEVWARDDVVFSRSVDDTFGFLPDVPAEVRAAAERETVVVPRGLAVDFGRTAPALEAASAIRCPVLLVLGDPDASAAPAAEPGLYPSSARVNLLELHGSAHNHHLSAVRGELWTALDRLLRAAVHTHQERQP